MDEVTAYCQEKGYALFPISAATGKGIEALLHHVVKLRDQMDPEPIVFEREYFIDEPRLEEEEGDGILVEKLQEALYRIRCSGIRIWNQKRDSTSFRNSCETDT